MFDFTTAEFWDERYAQSESVWSITPNQFVVEYLSNLSAGKIIDLAGGEGRNALWFASRGWQAENADISSVAVEKFRVRAQAEGLSEQCVGTVLDSTALGVTELGSTDSRSFSLAPADLGVIAYLQIPNEGLAQSIRGLVMGLRPGATVFGVWHARENLTEGYGGPQRADVLPSVSELESIASDCGLIVTECRLRDRFVEVEVDLEGGGEGEGSGQVEIKRAIDVILLATVS